MHISCRAVMSIAEMNSVSQTSLINTFIKEEIGRKGMPKGFSDKYNYRWISVLNSVAKTNKLMQFPLCFSRPTVIKIKW